jgi:hypothetical protein
MRASEQDIANRGVRIGWTREVDLVGLGLLLVELADDAEDDAVEDLCLRDEVEALRSTEWTELPAISDRHFSRT